MVNGELVRLWRRLAGAAVLITLSGCAGLARTALTGGSVPIGNALLQGVVIRADNSSQPLAGATVTVSTGASQTTAVSGADGQFDLGQVQPGRLMCYVTERPNKNDLSSSSPTAVSTSWSWPIDVPVNTSAKIIAAVWPSSFDPKTVGNVSISPANVTLRPGESIRFTGTVTDTKGNVIPLRPSMMLTGTVGTLSADGTFTATTSGTGHLTAWMAGYGASTDIQVVSASGGSSPSAGAGSGSTSGGSAGGSGDKPVTSPLATSGSTVGTATQ